jgi:outer membrane protein OmpA-like peptidoglycan-associated protein
MTEAGVRPDLGRPTSDFEPKMNTQGFGDTKPLASNTKSDGSDDPDGRQKNRRVEITLKKH